MNRTAISAYAALGLALTIGMPEAGAQSTSKCRPADWRSDGIISHLKYRISATDPRDIRLRDSVYRIPVVPPNQITVVTDERICAKLVDAYSRGASGWVPVNLYVIKLGDNHYAVMDPEHKAGGFSMVMIYDSKYVRVGGWTGG
ncbi:MAG TPA: hypothetical protein VMM17_08470 [Gemmatimonadaceae bacterium]|nr:hypothetical protein [Gemmatimonadaceae bacterium]